MLVKAIRESMQHYVAEANNRYSTTFPRTAVNINKIALMLVVVAALASLPQVQAGPLSYSACCLGCTALAPPAVPACLTLCAPVLFFPSP